MADTMNLTVSERLSLAYAAMGAALEKGQPQAQQARRVRWVLLLIAGLGVA